MHSLNKIFGTNLKYYRNLENLSQEKYYSKYELSIKHMANVERGKVNVTLNFVEKVSEAIGISPQDLLTFNEDKIINKKRVDEKIKIHNK